MIKYIIRDMTAALSYLPYGLVAGIFVFLLLGVVNKWRVKQQKAQIPVLKNTCLFMYVFIILSITFLSREGGSTNKIDLQIFSTWGINNRNNAYVLENVFLFIPYGFLCAWAIPNIKNLFRCTMLGLLTSMGIEFLQLITERGCFQIDDILTNTLGAVLGYLLYCCVRRSK